MRSGVPLLFYSMEKPKILLTNDDGIQSPGLWAAAEALSALGFVTVAAPREQSSGMGRSLPGTSDGIIQPETLVVHGQEWTVYAVGGSPAQAVLHAILEIMPQPPDLVVSGINYGENIGTGVTISGTVGAAMEAAALGYKALAVSLETDQKYHLSYSQEINFSAAALFTARFARMLLDKQFPLTDFGYLPAVWGRGYQDLVKDWQLVRVLTNPQEQAANQEVTRLLLQPSLRGVDAGLLVLDITEIPAALKGNVELRWRAFARRNLIPP